VLSAEQDQKMQWGGTGIARRHPVPAAWRWYAVSGSSFGIEGLPDDEARALLMN